MIINRFFFVVLLGSLALAVYLWKRFKPEGWESPEFKYHPGTGEDLPDYPLGLNENWFGSAVYSSGTEMRSPEDLERYQEFLGVMRDGESLTERKDEMMRRPGYPFYPNRKSLLTWKLLVITFIVFVIVYLLASAF